ncbi:MAG: single-stranded DNA-binding protein [Gammaproteobacteria bacterium]|nr:single-stranded DNA-binding protein [Gammaproteobacteria bacterium]
MARGLNKVMLIGNLGRDPETRFTQSGSAVTRFSVATSESWRDKSTQEMQQRTEWHDVVCFARLGEIASEYLKKGSKVYIEGGLRTSSWEKDGNTRYRTEVIAREMQMLDSRGANSGGYDGEPPQGGSQDKRPDPPQSNEPDLEDFDDDIPF